MDPRACERLLPEQDRPDLGAVTPASFRASYRHKYAKEES
jgi:hypothetical protein